jgi:hypothetical protein
MQSFHPRRTPRTRLSRAVFTVVNIEQSGRTLSEADLAACEDRLGFHLPEPYRRFLLRNNGGRPSPDTIDIENLPGGPTDVHTLFGTDETEEIGGLDWYISTFSERIPRELVPIARDSGGNLFCISLSESDYGSVVYCDLDSSFHVGGASYYRVAPDFDSFLEDSVARG